MSSFKKLEYIDINDDYDIESLGSDCESIEYVSSNNMDAYDEYVYDGDNYEITLVQTTDCVIVDPEIDQFISFCKRKKLFDDTFYDYGNIFSVMATKLPDTFKKISKNGKSVTMTKFKTTFEKKYKFKGNVLYIYKLMDQNNRGFITWNEFKDFFLPYIKNITM
jgi:hypothetical protein